MFIHFHVVPYMNTEKKDVETNLTQIARKLHK